MQSIILIRNNRFVSLFVRKNGPVHVAEPGLMANRQVADEIQVNLEFL